MLWENSVFTIFRKFKKCSSIYNRQNGILISNLKNEKMKNDEKSGEFGFNGRLVP